jgi:hypothetical protein
MSCGITLRFLLNQLQTTFIYDSGQHLIYKNNCSEILPCIFWNSWEQNPRSSIPTQLPKKLPTV